MSQWSFQTWTDDELAARDDALTEQRRLIHDEQSAIGIEQARRRIELRYALWRGKKSDIQFDYDNEAEAQGVTTKQLLR